VGGIISPPERISPGHGDKKYILVLFLLFFAVFETFSGPTPLLSQQYPDDLVFVSVGARSCLQNENGEEKDMILGKQGG
jgi:hypothetical protein